MQIARWNPFREFEAFFRQHDRPFGLLGQNHWSNLEADWAPSVDVVENDTAFVIKAELPAMKKEDIKVQISQGLLTISGERKQEHTDEKEHRVERFYGRFSRSFSLPGNVTEDNIDAEYKDGVLYLTLPKTERAKAISREVSIH